MSKINPVANVSIYEKQSDEEKLILHEQSVKRGLLSSSGDLQRGLTDSPTKHDLKKPKKRESSQILSDEDYRMRLLDRDEYVKRVEARHSDNRSGIGKLLDKIDKMLNQTLTFTLKTTMNKMLTFLLICPSIYADHATTLLSVSELWSQSQQSFAVMTIVIYIIVFLVRYWCSLNHAALINKNKLNEEGIEHEEMHPVWIFIKTILLFDVVEGQYRLAFLADTEGVISLGGAQSEILSLFDSVPNIIISLFSQCYSSSVSAIVIASSFTSMLTLSRTITNNCFDPLFDWKLFQDPNEKIGVIQNISEVMLTFVEMVGKAGILVAFAYAARPWGAWIYLITTACVFLLWVVIRKAYAKKGLRSIIGQFLRGVLPVCLHFKPFAFFHFHTKYTASSSIMKVKTSAMVVTRSFQIIVLTILAVLIGSNYTQLDNFYPKLIFYVGLGAAIISLVNYIIDIYFVDKLSKKLSKEAEHWKKYLLELKGFHEFVNTKADLLNERDAEIRHIVSTIIRSSNKKAITYVAGLLKYHPATKAKNHRELLYQFPGHQKNLDLSREITNLEGLRDPTFFGPLQYILALNLLYTMIPDFDQAEFDFFMHHENVYNVMLDFEPAGDILQYNEMAYDFSSENDTKVWYMDCRSNLLKEKFAKSFAETLKSTSGILETDYLELEPALAKISVFRFKKLTNLNVQNLPDYDPRLVGVIMAANKRQLKEIKLTFAGDHFGDNDLDKLSQAMIGEFVVALENKQFKRPPLQKFHFGYQNLNDKQNVTSEGLQTLIRIIRSLTENCELEDLELNLSGWTAATDEGIEECTKYFSKLKRLSLDFSYCQGISDKGLKIIFNNLSKQLEHFDLKFHHCARLQGEWILAFSNSPFGTYLKSLFLNFSEVKGFSNLVLQELSWKISNFSFLHRLHLELPIEEHLLLNKKGYLDIENTCNNLQGNILLVANLEETLNAIDSEEIEKYSALLRNPNNKKMRLKWKEGRSLDYQKLAQYSSGHIHHLKLNFVDFKGMTNEWIEEFAKSGIEPIKANLKHFEVAFNAEIIDAKLIAFAEQIIGKLGEQLIHLKVIMNGCQSLSSYGYDNLASNGIAPLKNLEHLEVGCYNSLYITNLSGIGGALSSLSNLKHLSLDMSYCYQIPAYTFQTFFETYLNYVINTLEHIDLNLYGCNRINETAITYLGETLGKMNKLSHFSMNLTCCNPITQALFKDLSIGFSKLSGNLKEIYLNVDQIVNINDESLKDLTEQSLTPLIKTIESIKLNLSQANITEGGLKSLVSKLIEALAYNLKQIELKFDIHCDLSEFLPNISGPKRNTILCNSILIMTVSEEAFFTEISDLPSSSIFFMEAKSENINFLMPSLSRYLLKNTSLKVLSLDFSQTSLDDAGFSQLQKFWKTTAHIEKLSINIKDCKLISNKFFNELMWLKKEHLKSLSLECTNCNIFNESLNIIKMIRNMDHLETFEMRYSGNVTLVNDENFRNQVLHSGAVKIFMQIETGILASSNPSLFIERMNNLVGDWKKTSIYFKKNSDENIISSFFSQGLYQLKDSIQELEIDLSGCRNLTDESLKEISEKGIGTLESLSKLVLNLNSNSILTDTGLSSLAELGIGKLGNKLKILDINIEFCTRITEKSLMAIGEAIGKLKGSLVDLMINLSRCYQISDLGLRDLSELGIGALKGNLKSLELKFSEISKITDQGLKDFAEKGIKPLSGSLENLNLDFRLCSSITDEGLNSLAEQGLGFLNGCLKQLELNFTECIKISDEGITHLASLGLGYLGTTLEKLVLNLRNCLKITDEGCKALSEIGIGKLLNLKYLDLTLRRTKITDTALQDLGSLGLGKITTLENIQLNFQRCNSITDKGLVELAQKGISKNSELKQLSLNIGECTNISDSGMNDLSLCIGQLKSLNHMELTLSYCDLIKDEGIKNLAKNGIAPLQGSLKHLEIYLDYCTGISDESASELGSVIGGLNQTLQHLLIDFQYCQVTDVGLNALTEFGIKQLGITLKYLSLNFTSCAKLTDQSTKKLANDGIGQLRSLEHLDLIFWDCQSLSDATLKELGEKGISNLRGSLKHLKLHFSRCISISDVGVKELAELGIGRLAGKLKYLFLNFAGTRITDKALKDLGEHGISHLAGTLQHLDLSFQSCGNLTDSGVQDLVAHGFSNLQGTLRHFSLDLTGVRLTDIGLKDFSEKGLSNVAGTLNYLELILFGCTDITDDGLIELGKGIGKAENLQILKLNFLNLNRISDSGLKGFNQGLRLLKGSIQELEWNLTYCKKLSDVALKDIAEMIAGFKWTLQKFGVQFTTSPVTNEGLKELMVVGIGNLKETLTSFDLQIQQGKIEDSGFTALAEGIAQLKGILRKFKINFGYCHQIHNEQLQKLKDIGIASVAGTLVQLEIEMTQCAGCDYTGLSYFDEYKPTLLVHSVSK